jgi:hypothetical protein
MTGGPVEFTADLLARLSSGGICSLRCAPLGDNNQFHRISPNSQVSGLPWREQRRVRYYVKHEPSVIRSLEWHFTVA